MAFTKPTTTRATTQDERSVPRDLAGLIQRLQDDQASVRRWAARDLAAFPEASQALVERLRRENDPGVREAIMLSLVQIGDRTAAMGLAECLRSDDAQLRNEAIEAMKLMPEAAAPVITDLLSDPDPDVRIFAVNVLESLRHPEVEQWLIDVIRRDDHINVCATAVDLLGEVGSATALPALAELKARFADQPYIAFAVDLAIRRIREE